MTPDIVIVGLIKLNGEMKTITRLKNLFLFNKYIFVAFMAPGTDDVETSN